MVSPIVNQMINRIAKDPIYECDKSGKPTSKVIVDEDEYITASHAEIIEKHYAKSSVLIKVKPFVTQEIEYISPELDEKSYIADISTPVDTYGNIMQVRVAGRHFSQMELFHVSEITHRDVHPSQIFSANPSMIPFINHNYTARAQIATNQLRQALPLLKSEVPLVGT